MGTRTRRIRKFGDEALVSQLMPSYSKGKVWIRLVLFSIGFFFFVIGLARPQIGAKLKEHETKGAEIMVVLDVSNSMLAEDYSPNRLERAKLAISRLVDKLRDDLVREGAGKKSAVYTGIVYCSEGLVRNHYAVNACVNTRLEFFTLCFLPIFEALGIGRGAEMRIAVFIGVFSGEVLCA